MVFEVFLFGMILCPKLKGGTTVAVAFELFKPHERFLVLFSVQAIRFACSYLTLTIKSPRFSVYGYL